MERRYYTPEFHEFHEGFEYQDKYFNANWEEKMFSYNEARKHDRMFFLKALDSKQIRVKYLDHEDIESLGWTLRTDNNADKFTPEYTIARWSLKTHSEGFCTIYDDTAVDEYCFRGKIKNKSELKRIMHQIGILEDGKIYFDTPNGIMYLDLKEYKKKINWEDNNLGKK